MTIHITATDAFNALEKAVQLKGRDYVYSSGRPAPRDEMCFYTNEDGTPSCIAATALNILGVDHTQLIEQITIAGGALAELKDTGAVSLTLDAERILTTAQSNQDSGMEWGEALDTTRLHHEIRNKE